MLQHYSGTDDIITVHCGFVYGKCFGCSREGVATAGHSIRTQVGTGFMPETLTDTTLQLYVGLEPASSGWVGGIGNRNWATNALVYGI